MRRLSLIGAGKSSFPGRAARVLRHKESNNNNNTPSGAHSPTTTTIIIITTLFPESRQPLSSCYLPTSPHPILPCLVFDSPNEINSKQPSWTLCCLSPSWATSSCPPSRRTAPPSTYCSSTWYDPASSPEKAWQLLTSHRRGALLFSPSHPLGSRSLGPSACARYSSLRLPFYFCSSTR